MALIWQQTIIFLHMYKRMFVKKELHKSEMFQKGLVIIYIHMFLFFIYKLMYVRTYVHKYKLEVIIKLTF